MEKMKKISKGINIFLSIFFWLGIAILSTVMIIFGILAIFPESPINDMIQIGFDAGILRFEFAPEKVEISSVIVASMNILNLFFILIYHVFMIIQLKNIFRPMAEGTPFVKKVSVSIRNIAIAFLIFNIVYNVMEVLVGSVIYHEFNLSTLFLNENIISCSMQVNFDSGFIFVFVILLALSYVFKYGEELQKLSDETL